MKQWISEFKSSWHDKNFICAISIFIFSYALIALVAMLLPQTVFIAVLGAVAGWQVAGWSHELAPKIKQRLFKD
jgi:hypothetical protein